MKSFFGFFEVVFEQLLYRGKLLLNTLQRIPLTVYSSLYIKISTHIYWKVYLVNKNSVILKIIFLPASIDECVLFSIGI